MGKREQILIAAMKLFIERGVQATPMSAISKAANAGMGTIYNYFATKEDLINAIYLFIKKSEIEAIGMSVNPDDSLKVRFLGYYTSFIRFYLKYPEGFAFMDQMQNSPIIQPEIKVEGKAAFQPVFELIRQGKTEGILKDIDEESMLYFLAGTITSYVRKAINDRTDSNLDQQLRMVWDAIKE